MQQNRGRLRSRANTSFSALQWERRHNVLPISAATIIIGWLDRSVHEPHSREAFPAHRPAEVLKPLGTVSL